MLRSYRVVRVDVGNSSLCKQPRNDRVRLQICMQRLLYKYVPINYGREWAVFVTDLVCSQQASDSYATESVILYSDFATAYKIEIS